MEWAQRAWMVSMRKLAFVDHLRFETTIKVLRRPSCFAFSTSHPKLMHSCFSHSTAGTSFFHCNFPRARVNISRNGVLSSTVSSCLSSMPWALRDDRPSCRSLSTGTTSSGRDDMNPEKGNATADNASSEEIRANEYYRAYEKLFLSDQSSFTDALSSTPTAKSMSSQQTDAKHELISEHLTSSQNSNELSDKYGVSSLGGGDRSSPIHRTALSHVDERGKARMVEVGEKPDTRRVAVATCCVRLTDTAFRLVAENRAKKGDVLGVARLAGIAGVKRTSELIPLCHNIAVTGIKVDLELEHGACMVRVRCEVSTMGRTGVEMEALTGATVAALTVYDMCKAASHRIVIDDVRLLSKTGGKSGEFRWDEANTTNT